MTFPNMITLLRLLLLVPFLVCLILYSPEREWLRYLALALFAVAAISDFIDGMLARRWKQQSRLGQRLDPLADKLVVNLSFVFLAVSSHFDVPQWLPAIILLRDAVIVVGGLYAVNKIESVHIKPRLLGKVTTAVQLVTLIIILLKLDMAVAGVPLTETAIYLTLVLTVLSLLDYLYMGTRAYLKERTA